jgi:hypothetical protein
MLFKKSRLVVQAYNNKEKKIILTQSLTIQKASQRIIVVLALSLANKKIRLLICDITQVYIQLITLLNRLILARLPKEIKDKFLPNTIIIIHKLLYRILEARTH